MYISAFPAPPPQGLSPVQHQKLHKQSQCKRTPQKGKGKFKISGSPAQEQPVLGLGLLRPRLRLRLPGAVGQGAGQGVPLTVHDQQRPGNG
jgi:hypothetical protein